MKALVKKSTPTGSKPVINSNPTPASSKKSSTNEKGMIKRTSLSKPAKKWQQIQLNLKINLFNIFSDIISIQYLYF